MQSRDDEQPTAGSPAAKPPTKRTRGKGAPPPQGDTLDALRAEPAPPGGKAKGKGKDGEAGDKKATKAPAKERTEPLNFRVTPDFRRAFKRAAAAQDCKKVELLERIFAEWSTRNPA